jgi:hypothetical protein
MGYNLSMSETPIQNETPFKFGEEIMHDGEHTESLHRTAQDPDVLVKKLFLRGMGDIHSGIYVPNGMYTEKQLRAEYQQSITKLKELLSKYLPDNQLVWAKDELGDKKGYLIVDAVKPVEQKPTDSELDNFLYQIVSFGKQQIPEQSQIEVPEIDKDGNVLYGSTRNNAAPQYYLVDMYPLVFQSQAEFHDAVLNFIQKSGSAASRLPKTSALLNSEWRD